MVFCNDEPITDEEYGVYGHNPYFSRWFSAIMNMVIMNLQILSHNPYFSRWFSAILLVILNMEFMNRHNPYFSRWFSAMGLRLL